MIAAGASVAATADAWSPGHRDMVHASGGIGDAAVGSETSTEGAGVVVENEGIDERWKELRPRLN